MKLSTLFSFSSFLRPVALLGGVLIAMPAVWAGCFDVSQSQPAVLAGRLEIEIFAGPPNYTSVKKGDMPESAYILHLEKPICTKGDGFSDGKPFSEVHLLPSESNAKLMKSLLRQSVKVRLTGQSGPETGHHHAPLIATVQSIVEIDPADITNEYGTAATTIRGFYEALRLGIGEQAAEFIVPEKRKGAFDPAAMTRFYGGLAEPMVLDSIDKLSNTSFHVTYRYRAGKTVCNGAATVDTTNRKGEFLIQSIKPLTGC